MRFHSKFIDMQKFLWFMNPNSKIQLKPLFFPRLLFNFDYIYVFLILKSNLNQIRWEHFWEIKSMNTWKSWTLWKQSKRSKFDLLNELFKQELHNLFTRQKTLTSKGIFRGNCHPWQNVRMPNHYKHYNYYNKQRWEKLE